MTDDPGTQEVPLTDTVEALMLRLETEHKWTNELRTDLEAAERTCNRLLVAVEAAAETLPKDDRLEIKRRFRRIRPDILRQGRPPTDSKQGMLLQYLVDRSGETVANVQLRQYLTESGLPNGSQYVSNLMSQWAAEGMVTRVGHGCYKVNGEHARLRAVRFSERDPHARAKLSAERAKLGTAESKKETTRKVILAKMRIAEMRRENFYVGPPDWPDELRAEYNELKAFVEQHQPPGD